MPEFADGFSNQSGGVNEGVDSMLVAETAYARGVNTSVRGGLIKSRPALRELDVDDPILSPFLSGKFQGGEIWKLDSGHHLVCAVAGKILIIDLETLAVVDVGLGLSATVDQMYFCQADKYMIVQDGENRPIIIDPDATPMAHTSSYDDSEVPVGTAMAYGHGRLFVAVSETDEQDAIAPSRFVLASDVCLATNPSKVLQFTETDYLTGGGALGLANELGFIKAMAFVKQARTGDNNGSLVVFGEYGASAFAVYRGRDFWMEYDISEVLFVDSGAGMSGPWGLCHANTDIVYRGNDGHRTLGQSSASISGEGAGLSSIPISSAIRPLMEMDNRTGKALVSMANVQNRILSTFGYARDDVGWYFRGLTSIESSSVSSFGQSVPPVYDGMWTGLRFLQVLSGRRDSADRHFVIARDSTTLQNRIFVLDHKETSRIDGGSVRIKSRVYTRAINWTKIRMDVDKIFRYARLWVMGVVGSTTIRLYYRRHGYPLWSSAGEVTIPAQASGYPLNVPSLKFTPDSMDVCDPVLQRPTLVGDSFQFMIEWEGALTISMALFYASPASAVEDLLACEWVPEESVIEATEESGVEKDDFDYAIC